MLTGWSAGCVSWCRMRTLRPDWAAALNTARRKFSLLTTCEQEKVNRIPPGLIFRKRWRSVCGNLARHCAIRFMFGESWWIQDDEIVVASHLFEIFESVFRISFVARITWKVQFHVPVGQRDRFGRAVDRVNDLGSSPHGIEREAASVAEHVQYGASFGIAFQQRPVFALIDKETSLLPLCQSTQNFRPFSRAMSSTSPPYR